MTNDCNITRISNMQSYNCQSLFNRLRLPNLWTVLIMTLRRTILEMWSMIWSIKASPINLKPYQANWDNFLMDTRRQMEMWSMIWSIKASMCKIRLICVGSTLIEKQMAINGLNRQQSRQYATQNI